jgi:diguanylate cyclase (GGDEF)-like protein
MGRLLSCHARSRSSSLGGRDRARASSNILDIKLQQSAAMMCAEPGRRSIMPTPENLRCEADAPHYRAREVRGETPPSPYREFISLHQASSVRQLHQAVPPVLSSTLCSDVLKLFLQDAGIYAVAIVDDAQAPLALIERHAYVEKFSRAFTVDLFGKKPLAQLGETAPAINHRPIVVDANTSIDDVAAIVIDAGMEQMASGFIVTEGERYLGIANAYALLNHITQRKQSELYYLAHYDVLTRIPNRMLLNDRLQMACHEADRNGTLVGLVFVDLDRFKQINDTMGHRFGDLLLQAVAERLEGCIRRKDTVARLGGDEFAILLGDIADAGVAEATAQRIVDHFSAPFAIAGHEVFVTASLGIALYPRDECEVANLIVKADAAMYDAKQSGRNAFRAYQPGLSMHSIDRLALEAALRHAVSRDELVLHYQPQIAAATGKLVGVEALVRWQHPERGLLTPQAFIGIAEDSGLIVDIGNWVLREACRQQQRWSAAGLPPVSMAINISAVQFRRDNFAEVVRGIIRESGADAEFIELELTENVAMHHGSDVLKTLDELKRIGVRLAIDDFGTGFSNLSYLQRFPIDRLKIDRTFVRGIEHAPANAAIVRAIVALAKGLALETVAEGVETSAEHERARACGCDTVQGYLYARPMAAADLREWMLVGGARAKWLEAAAAP